LVAVVPPAENQHSHEPDERKDERHQLRAIANRKATDDITQRSSKIFFIAFFSATIDGRNLICGHKLKLQVEISLFIFRSVGEGEGWFEIDST
jgi:hypothetical protein